MVTRYDMTDKGADGMRSFAKLLCGCAFFSLLWFSCTMEVEFKDKETAPRLVLNGMISSGDSICFKVSRSIFFLDPVFDNTAPEGVAAQLYVNGNLVSGLNMSDDTVYNDSYAINGRRRFLVNKLFSSSYVAQQGDRVRVVVSAPGYETVEAECVVAQYNPQVEVSYVVKDSFQEAAMYGDSTIYFNCDLEVQLKVTDPTPGTMDFYVLRMNPNGGEMGDNTGWNAYLESDDPIFGGGSVVSNWLDLDLGGYYSLMFDDRLFDGKSYTIRLKMSVYGNFKEGEDVADMNLELLHLSRDLYQYYSTYCEEQEDWLNFFYEPVQTHNNVKNGYGVLGSASVQGIPIRLKIYPKK